MANLVIDSEPWRWQWRSLAVPLVEGFFIAAVVQKHIRINLQVFFLFPGFKKKKKKHVEKKFSVVSQVRDHTCCCFRFPLLCQEVITFPFLLSHDRGSSIQKCFFFFLQPFCFCLQRVPLVSVKMFPVKCLRGHGGRVQYPAEATQVIHRSPGGARCVCGASVPGLSLCIPSPAAGTCPPERWL